MLALLLAQASAVDAERAFAADAQKLGQWTAFRKWATDDAVMFTPRPVKAKDWLKDLKDPVRPVDWRPAGSFVSCDGATAVNTGPWRRPDGAVGYFTTVWQRQANGGWKWLLDHGGELDKVQVAPSKPRVVTASCDKPGLSPIPPSATDGGTSSDGTLRWWYSVAENGRRTVAVDYWDGRAYHPGLANQVDPPAAP